MMDFKPKNRTVEFGDAFGIDRNSAEYKLGIRQLAEWHARCRANRLGIKRKPKVTHSVSAARHSARMAKGGAK